jgi:protein SCO1/2
LIQRISLLIALLAPSWLVAQAPVPAEVRSESTAQATSVAKVMKQMGIDQKLGQTVALEAKLQETSGRTIRFGDLFGNRPIIILPMFFNCQSSCGRQVNSLLRGLVKLNEMTAGQQFDVVLLSVHPKETPALTAVKKVELMRIYERPNTEAGFHLLTGDEDNIKKVTDSLGFRYVYIPERNQVYHPAGAMILTPEGKISQVIYGAEYPSLQLSRGVALAAENKIGNQLPVVMFGCLAFDPMTGQRTLLVHNVLKVACVVTLVALVGWIAAMSFQARRPSTRGGSASPTV